MSRPVLVAVPVIALLLAGAAGARAQGLGDAAARERQKRDAQQKAKEAKEPARVYDNQDLPQHEAEKGDKKKGATKAAEPAPAPPPPGGESGGDAASEIAARRARITQAESAAAAAKAQVEKLEARLRELQDMLNPMSGTYIYGARVPSGDLASEEARVRDELRQTEARLGDARKALDAANHELEDAQLGRMPSPQS